MNSFRRVSAMLLALCMIFSVGGLFFVKKKEKGEISRAEGDTLVVAEIVPESTPTNPTSATEPSKVTTDDGVVQTGDLHNIKIVLWSLLFLCILLLAVFVQRSRNQ